MIVKPIIDVIKYVPRQSTLPHYALYYSTIRMPSVCMLFWLEVQQQDAGGGRKINARHMYKVGEGGEHPLLGKAEEGGCMYSIAEMATNAQDGIKGMDGAKL